MSWPMYHRDGGDPEGMAQRRQAEALQPLIMAAWHRSYRHQRPELRRRRIEALEHCEISEAP